MPIASFSAETATANLRRERLSRWPDGRRDDSRLHGIVSVELEPSFALTPGEQIFTVGSCFARHIERRLAELGFDIVTQRLQLTPEEIDARDGAGTLNAYNPPSILNVFRWALDPGGGWPEGALIEEPDGSWTDPHLPGFAPSGTLAMVQARRRKIMDLYAALPGCRVVLMTLGMVEAWFDGRTGLYLNGAPPAAAMRLEPDRFRLDVLTVQETREALEAIHDLLRRHGHPEFRMLVTVSPVPLKASFTGKDAIAANSYGKSALRAAVEEFVCAHDDVDYFPSYEIVTLTQRSWAFAPDNIHVALDVVDAVMDRVVARYAPGLFEEAQELSEQEVKTIRWRIDRFLEVGEFTKAARSLSDLVKAETWRRAGYEEFEFRFEYGRTLLETGEAVAALIQLERAAELEPRSAPALFHLGLAHLKTGRGREAETCLRQAVQADPQRRGYRLQLARTLFDLRRYAEAERQLIPLTTAQPGDQEAAHLQQKCRAAVEASMGERLKGALVALSRRQGVALPKLAGRKRRSPA